MNYDNWKLASPPEYSQVSECCGADTTENKVCFDDETIDEYDGLVCDDCGCECELIDEEEYRSGMRESYLEDMADEIRHNERDDE